MFVYPSQDICSQLTRTSILLLLIPTNPKQNRPVSTKLVIWALEDVSEALKLPQIHCDLWALPCIQIVQYFNSNQVPKLTKYLLYIIHEVNLTLWGQPVGTIMPRKSLCKQKKSQIRLLLQSDLGLFVFAFFNNMAYNSY